MAYFEITGIPLRPREPEFSPTVSLLLEKGRGLTLISDDGELPRELIESLTGYGRFVGEIFLNGMSIDPVPARRRPIKVLGNTPGIIPGKTVIQNFEDALRLRNLSEGESAMLIERELSEGPLSGFADVRAGTLDSAGKSILAATRYLMSGCDLLLIANLPVGRSKSKSETNGWRPGFQLDALLGLKNLLRRFRATWISTLSDPICVQILSDNIAIFADGNLVQEGSLRECMNAPSSRTVADFLAFPKMNYLKVTVGRDGPFITLQSGRYVFHVSDFIKRQITHRVGEEIIMGVRPEDLGIRAYQTGDPTVLNLARVLMVDDFPGMQLVRLDLEGMEWIAIVETVRAAYTGQLVELRPDPDRIHLFHSLNSTSLLD